jgi:uncharacterized protein (DUF58 family)
VRSKIESYFDDKMSARAERQYIMPTPSGYSFGICSFILFLAGIIYGNNIVLALAFLGTSFFVIEMFQTHYALKNLNLKHSPIEDQFMGRAHAITLQTEHGEFSEIKISKKELFAASQKQTYSEAKGQRIILAIEKMQRGLHKIERSRLTLWGEFHLFFTWKYLDENLEFYTYPAIKQTDEVIKAHARIDLPEEFDGHKKTDSFSSKRIDWKVYGKTKELYEKTFSSESSDDLILNYNDLQGDHEEKLSLITSILYYTGKHYKKITIILPTGEISVDTQTGFKPAYRFLAQA